MRSISHILVLAIWLFSLNTDVKSQTSELNAGIIQNEYAVLRNTFILPFDDSDKSSVNFKFIVSENKKLTPTHLFIGANDFVVKCKLDIYNNTIAGDFKKTGEVVEYQYKRGSLDSLHMLNNGDQSIIEKYFYNGKLDIYAKVIDEGQFTILEGYHFEFKKGVVNPILDAGSDEDKIVVKKKMYLNDSGLWWLIPKQKKELIEFVRSHFRKTINKSTIKGKKSLEVIITLN